MQTGFFIHWHLIFDKQYVHLTCQNSLFQKIVMQNQFNFANLLQIKDILIMEFSLFNSRIIYQYETNLDLLLESDSAGNSVTCVKQTSNSPHPTKQVHTLTRQCFTDWPQYPYVCRCVRFPFRTVICTAEQWGQKLHLSLVPT